jgi:hypothetical protein
MKLEGFPGAPIEPDLFPFRDGAVWVFQDRLNSQRPPLRLEVHRRQDHWILTGTTEEEAILRVKEGFVELEHKGQVIGRPYKLAGYVGDTWSAPGATYTVFGYDTVEVMGEKKRALVVAVDRPPSRDLHWYAAGYGWVRLRTEKQGRAVRDGWLVEYVPGTTN